MKRLWVVVAIVLAWISVTLGYVLAGVPVYDGAFLTAISMVCFGAISVLWGAMDRPPRSGRQQ